MSALFPTETKDDIPSPRALARSITAKPRAPLWERNPTRPCGGYADAKVAFSRTSGSVFRIPMQFGPMSRIPACRHTARSSRWRSRPSSPVSANPAEMTTSPRTPLAAHSRAASTTPGAGTTITARSTGPGTSPIER